MRTIKNLFRLRKLTIVQLEILKEKIYKFWLFCNLIALIGFIIGIFKTNPYVIAGAVLFTLLSLLCWYKINVCAKHIRDKWKQWRF